MNVSLVSGIIQREPFYRPADGDKGAFLGLTIETGNEFKVWHEAVAFGELAEHGSILREGDVVYATGSHSLDKYKPEFPKLKLRLTSIECIGTQDDVDKLESKIDVGADSASDDSPDDF